MHHDMKYFITMLKNENADMNYGQLHDVVGMYDSVKNAQIPIQTMIPALRIETEKIFCNVNG